MIKIYNIKIQKNLPIINKRTIEPTIWTVWPDIDAAAKTRKPIGITSIRPNPLTISQGMIKRCLFWKWKKKQRMKIKNETNYKATIYKIK